MDKLVYTSLVSVNQARIEREMITNEIANIATVGFKRSFENAMVAGKTSGPGYDSRYKPMNVAYDLVEMNPGARVYTGRQTDIFLNDASVLGVKADDGSVAYTRRGDLRVSGTGILQTGNGKPVVTENGDVITCPLGLEISITKEGDVMARDITGTAPDVLVARMELKEASKTTMVRREDGLFRSQDQNDNGESIFSASDVIPSVSPGFTEASNSEPIGALVAFMDIARSFEMQLKIVKEMKDLSANGAQLMKP